MKTAALAGLGALSIGCGQSVFLGDLAALDAALAPDLGRDAEVTDGPDAGSQPDTGLPADPGGRYLMVFQRVPAGVSCTGELAALHDAFLAIIAPDAGFNDVVANLQQNGETLWLSGEQLLVGFATTQLTLTEDTTRADLYHAARVATGSGPGDTVRRTLQLAIETSDPGSGILRGSVRIVFEGPPRPGQCVVDYQLTLYACGIGC